MFGKHPGPSNMHGVEILPLCAQADVTVDARGGRWSWGRRLRWSSEEALDHSKSLGKALGCSLDHSGGEFESWERVEGVSTLERCRRCVCDGGFSCKCGVLFVEQL